MRAAVIHEAGGDPQVRDIDEPEPGAGETLVHVSSAALNPHDLIVAAGVNQPPPVPYVPGTEGVGTLTDGSRVYFGLSSPPHGSLAERAVAPADSVQRIPPDIGDGEALAVGVAGVSAWLPLTWKAGLRPGEQVLVLGATGSVGRIAVQAARVLGAGRVVAAGRNRKALDWLGDRGADDTVVLDGDSAEALAKAGGDGFDVVLDLVYGPPFLAALRATRPGGRIVNVGMRAGRTVELPGGMLKRRDLLTYAGDQPSADLRRHAYAELVRHVAAGDIDVMFEELPLERVPEAWRRQASGPDTKLVLRL
ncbi:zinc-binding alcohol dehydrogenase family protein [Streptomyces sp. NPDC101225]|uniref:quinone oxidoreductase family protein n=1 Tax=Streptomyces sp. NPDC101225 TaxID=3366135 RepID=UPI0037FEA341